MKWALIGRNISYSLSPKLHQANIDSMGIDATYELWDIPNIVQAIDDLRHLSGFNITVPYKEAIVPYCQSLSEEAKQIGAVNCVNVVDGQLIGYNTDGYGFIELLKMNHLLTNLPLKVLIIGAGGAAKAVYFALKNTTNWSIDVTNRTIEHANFSQSVIAFQSIQMDQYDMVINATNVSNPISIHKINLKAVFIDLNYHFESEFLKTASLKGAKTIDGLAMLIYQAAKSFTIWTNREANLFAMNESMRKEN